VVAASIWHRASHWGVLLVSVLCLICSPPSIDAQIPPPTYGVHVTPKGTNVSWTEGTTDHTSFTVKNTGNQDDVYFLSCTATGPVTCVSIDSTSVLLAAGASKLVNATYTVGGQGTGVVKLTALADAGESDYGYVNVSSLRPAGAPIVDASPYNYDDQIYGRCASACFAAMTSRTTVPYFSLGVPRQVALIYNGDRLNPHPFVLVNVTPDTTFGTWPTQYRLQIKVNGATKTFVNGDSILNFSYDHATMGTTPYRIGGQFDGSSYATNVYSMDILVTSVFASTTITNDVWVKLLVVNQNTSPVARGWSIASVQRLYPQTDGSAFIVEGDGSAVYFAAGLTGFNSPAGDFTVLIPSTLSGSSGWARLYPDSTKVVFNSAGLMTQMRDRFNNMSTVVYDASNRVSKIKDPLGFGDTLTYGSTGLSTIKDPGGRITTVTIDTGGRLTVFQDPDNGTTQYGYDAQKRLITITDRRHAVTTLGYDASSGLLASVTAPSVTFFDGTSGSPVTLFSAWQKVGVPYGPTSPTPFAPVSPDSVIATVTQPGGAVTRFTVNRWGTPRRTTDALSQVTLITFDSNGLPIKALYPSGRVDSTAYGPDGLPVFARTGSDSATHAHYTSWGVPDSTWGKGRPRVRNFIGPNGRLDSTAVGASVTRFTYDSAGRMRTTTDARRNLVVSRLYASSFGNMSRDSFPNGQVRTYLYDQFGRDTAVQVTSAPVRRTHYDLINRPTQQYDGVHGTPTTHTYDAALDTMMTDVQGQTYRSTYNAMGWLTQRTDPTGHAETYGYSRDGDLMRRTNRRGQTISYSYDALHRMTSDSGTNKPAEHWTYGSSGLLVTSASAVSTETAYLNVLGRADSSSTAIAGQTFWRRFHYTASGLIDTMTISGGGIPFRARTYAYDTTTWVLDTIRLGPAGTPVTTLQRDANMKDTSRTLPGGEALSLQYLPEPLVLGSVSTGAAYGISVNRQAEYDVLNRRVFQLLGDGSTGDKYVYDSLGRLVADSVMRAPTGNSCPGHPIIGPDGSNCVAGMQWTALSGTTFSYDSVGNRLDNGGAYGTGDRITSFATCSYVTDADGDVVSRTCGTQGVTFKWTADGRLDTTIVAGTTISYWYDAGGRLVRKDVSGTPQSYFLWDGANLLAELSGSGTSAVAEYSYYGIDRLHALVVGGRVYYAHTDVLGNVVALTDSTPQVKRSYKYDAWGALTGGTDNLPFSNADRARWKGALWLGPEVDLYYVRNRWYEPQSGRFLSEDPAGLAGGINPYLFVGDDPIDGEDASGLAGACIDQPGIFGHCGGNTTGAELDEVEYDPRALDDPAWDNYVALSRSHLSVQELIASATAARNAGFEGVVWSAKGGWYPGMKPGTVLAVGITFTLAVPGGGFTITVGNYNICCKWDEGMFLSIGSASGFDMSLGLSSIKSDNFAAFQTTSTGGCGGIGILDFAMSWCEYSNADGGTSSTFAGIGFIKGRKGSPWLAPGGQAGTVYTWASDPVPCSDPRGCGPY
jgi:RHS repeat-associated protein